MSSDQLVLTLWVALTSWVLGQVWLSQIVLYPLFTQVTAQGYRTYHSFYSRRIPLPVIAPCLASFLLPIPLAIFGPSVSAWLSTASVAAGLCGLAVTVVFLIPRHARLEANGKDEAVIAELLRYSWPRTLSITAQSVIAFLMLWYAG